MDKRIEALKTPEECGRFIKNALRLGSPELAQQARQRAVQLHALAHGATTDAEREAFEAVFAYEAVLSERHGRKIRAARTWPMIQRHGIIQAVERTVNRGEETVGYAALLEMGLEQFAFEAVVMRHPHLFSEQSVERCRQRVGEWQRA